MHEINFLAGEIIRCALYEGTIAVSPHDTRTCCVELSAGVNDGDVVELYDNVANTYDSGNGLPIVRKTYPKNSATIGRVISPPLWIRMPENSVSDWDTCLKHQWYRYATIILSKNIWVQDGVYKSNTFEGELRALCIAYDNEYGTYPENEHEGLSVFEFFMDNGVNIVTEPDNEYLKGAWDASDRWRNGEFSK